ncbi:glycosyltransferase family 4 protein [Flindersiella endophytica]
MAVSFGTRQSCLEGKVLRIVVVANLWPSPRRPAWGSFVANRVDALQRLGHEVRPVVCHDHPSAALRYASLAGQVLRAAAGKRAPRTIVEAHIAHPTGLFAAPLAARLRAPLVLFAHGSDVLRLPDRSGLDRTICQAVFRRAALVVANTDYLAAEVTERLGVEKDKVAVVSPGIRYDTFAAALPARSTELLFVGNLIHRKALDVLIDALAELPDPPALRVVGDGPERAGLEQQAAARGVRADFAGALSQEAVAAEMSGARLLAVPSREEALGLVALEAMAAGCVPVVSAVGGLAESVTEGVNGFSCPADDPSALAAALTRARTAVADPERLAGLRRAGDTVARSHDVDAAVAETVERFEALL